MDASSVKCLFLLFFVALQLSQATSLENDNRPMSTYYGQSTDLSDSANYSILEQNWQYKENINFSREWEGNQSWGGSHKFFSIQVDTKEKILEGKMREDCKDLRLAYSEKIVPVRIQAGTCNSSETWVYFSNTAVSEEEETEMLFDRNLKIEELELFYGNRIPNNGKLRVSPTNDNPATLVHPEGAIEMYYGSHGAVGTDYFTVSNDKDAPKQEWYASFSGDHGSVGIKNVYIQDDDGNGPTSRSVSGEPYTLDSSNAPSWLEQGDTTYVYMTSNSNHDGDSSTTSTKSAQWGYANYAPNDPSDPDPAEATGTSPVYTTSPDLNIDVSDPDGDDMDVTFYSGGGNQIDEHTGVSSGSTATVEWTSLNEGQSYDWYVEACDQDGECTTSSTYTFDVSSGPLEPDNPDPSDTATIYEPSGQVDLSARYRHTDGSSAQPGTLTFYNDDGSTIDSCQADHNNRCSVTKNVNSGNRYDWYVVADYNGQTATSDTWYFRTNTPPDEPDSPSPSDGASSVNYNTATLSVDVNDADGDDMDVTFSGSSASDSFSKTTSVSGSGEALVTVDNLAEGEQYNWEVTAEDEHGASTTSDTWSFTTNYLPTIEDPFPSDGAYISSDNTELRIDVSDQDGDSTNIRIFDDSGAQIGSGSTSDGSEVTVDTDYNGLSFGNSYDWTVEAEDSYGTNSRTFTFSVIGGGSFRTGSGIKYEYSSIIKSADETAYLEYEVSNKNVNDKDLETRISGINATFTEYAGDTHSYTLSGGTTKTFRLAIDEDQVGDHTLSVTTEDRELGVENVDEIPVLVREYPASDVQEIPGLMWLQLLALMMGATVLYSALL